MKQWYTVPMPVIRVTSLPFAHLPDMPAVLKTASAALSELLSLDEEHITLTWSYLRPGHYSDGGAISESQPGQGHPVLVDILVPDFNPPENRDLIIRSVAEVLSKTVGLPLENFFIHLLTAGSGSVFASGSIVQWQTPDQSAPEPAAPASVRQRHRTKD